VKDFFKVGAVTLCMIGLVACSVDQVTTTLDLAVDALATVAAVAAPQDVAYINLAASCLNAATVELETADTNLQKVTSITASCAKVVGNTSGLSPLGVALSNAISTFLNQVKTLEGNKNFAAAANEKTPKLNMGELKKISKKLAKIKIPK
jgi:hypothetical protein